MRRVAQGPPCSLCQGTRKFPEKKGSITTSDSRSLAKKRPQRHKKVETLQRAASSPPSLTSLYFSMCVRVCVWTGHIVFTSTTVRNVDLMVGISAKKPPTILINQMFSLMNRMCFGVHQHSDTTFSFLSRIKCFAAQHIHRLCNVHDQCVCGG